MNEIETKFYEASKNYFKQEMVQEITSDEGHRFATIKTKPSEEDYSVFNDYVAFDLTIESEFEITGKSSTVILPQSKNNTIAGYRPDFIICADGCTNFLIEIDGYEWHEKTKEQAITDRKKDRAYLKNGYIPIRFLGSEVFHNVNDCIKEMIEIVAYYIYLQARENEELKQNIIESVKGV